MPKLLEPPKQDQPAEFDAFSSYLPAERAQPSRGRWRLALSLFLATFASTYFVAAFGSGAQAAGVSEPSTLFEALAAILIALRLGFVDGLSYAFGVMAILTAHELGHYFQARRYGVPASLPYFIPMPLTPFGTMGAIIAMRSRTADPKALFDLAITGPLAGLVPALALSTIGLRLSRVELVETTAAENYLTLGEPLIFKLLSFLTLGPLEEGSTVVLHPIAFAGWVGIFITALNLLPIGQLDGGHILYTLLPRAAHAVSITFLAAAVVAVVVGGLWHWSVLILILLLIGVRHPPTADGDPIERKRAVLGWATLLFVVVGFTPTPFLF